MDQRSIAGGIGLVILGIVAVAVITIMCVYGIVLIGIVVGALSA